MKYTRRILQLGLLSVTVSANAQKQKQPNILFILADDLGWNDLGCTGSTYYETPHIDRIAANGMTFTNAYATCHVSSPSRASILTGRYPVRHGITNWIGEKSGEEWRSMGRNTKLLPADYERSLSLNETTLAQRLKEKGYKTFIAGKWHLGGEGSLPEDHGFDINIGGGAAGGPKGYFSPYKMAELTDGKPGEDLSIRLSNETVSFIREHRKRQKQQPFFAYLSFYAVHGPIQTTRERWSYFREKAEKEGIEENGFRVDRTLPVRQKQDNPVYAGLIQQMDDAVGNLLNALEEMGLDENTLIIFTSDNGGVSSGDAFSTSLLPLRGGKGRQWEGGLRVPFMIQHPQSGKGAKYGEGAKQCDVPVTGADFYPTLLEYARITSAPEQRIDGVSILPLLKGDKIADRPLFWHYPHYGNQGGEPSSIVRQGDWKLIFYHEDHRCELYNLAIDISESEPLNIQYPKKLKELHALLEGWLKETDARMPAADPLYDPLKEKQTKLKWQTTVLAGQEKLRKKMLSKEWSPNKSWWGSQSVED